MNAQRISIVLFLIIQILAGCASYQPPVDSQDLSEMQLTSLASLSLKKTQDQLDYCGSNYTARIFFTSTTIYRSCLTLSPDGRTLAIGPYTRDGPIELRRVEDNQLLWTINSNAFPMFSPDGRHLVISGKLRVEVWDANTGRLLNESGFYWPDFRAGYYRISPDSKKGVYGGFISRDGIIQLTTFPDMREIGDTVDSRGVVAFSGDGETMVVPGIEKINIYRTVDFELVRELPIGFDSGLRRTRMHGLSHDGELLVIYVRDMAVFSRTAKHVFTVVRTSDGEVVSSFSEEVPVANYLIVSQLAFSDDNEHLLVTGLLDAGHWTQLMIYAWRISDGSLLSSYRSPREKKPNPMFSNGWDAYNNRTWYATIHPALGALLVRIRPADEEGDPEQTIIDIQRHEELTELLMRGE